MHLYCSAKFDSPVASCIYLYKVQISLMQLEQHKHCSDRCKKGRKNRIPRIMKTGSPESWYHTTFRKQP